MIPKDGKLIPMEEDKVLSDECMDKARIELEKIRIQAHDMLRLADAGLIAAIPQFDGIVLAFHEWIKAYEKYDARVNRYDI